MTCLKRSVDFNLLLQFIHPKFRLDFLNGLLGMQGSEDLLLDLDRLRRVIIPPWRGRSVFNMQLELDCTATHINNLLKRSTKIFDLQSQSSQAQTWSYNDWADFLSKLAKILIGLLLTLSSLVSAALQCHLRPTSNKLNATTLQKL